ncbi:hypothetical protein [Methylobacterium sp. W2]|nr:hypothetical protein [Methylobacterium sp. W2]
MPANDNVAPLDVTALSIGFVAFLVLVGGPAVSIWLWSVWS